MSAGVTVTGCHSFADSKQVIYLVSPKMLSTDTTPISGASFSLTSKIMNVDEESQETPLLAENVGKKQRTPLPWSQLIIVMFLQLAEPLTSHAISPFTPELIRNFVTHGNESKVGYYVGLMQSLFYLTQAFTVLYWSRISDHIGRKPVIQIGILGLSFSLFCFGLSTTFWGLLLSRGLNGALDGNIGVLKSVMAEMTDATNIANAYAYVPLARSAGATIGPIIGGFLVRPAERFPDLFGNNAFLKKYPYFLPCAIPATFSLFAWLITFLFLKETLPAPISIRRLFNITKDPTPRNAIASSDASIPLLSGQNDDEDCSQAERPLPLRSLLIPRILIAAGNYASLSLVDIALKAIHPVFLSTPILLGGLGLPPSSIGTLLSVQGMLNGIFSIFFFAKIHNRWGAKKTFIAGVASAIPATVMFPIANSLARTQGYSVAVWIAIGIQIISMILHNLSFGAIFIFVSAASPNRASLGATNGLSQLSVSIMRTIGPASVNSLFSLSIEKGYLGGQLVYYVLVAITGVALALSSMLPPSHDALSRLRP